MKRKADEASNRSMRWDRDDAGVPETGRFPMEKGAFVFFHSIAFSALLFFVFMLFNLRGM